MTLTMFSIAENSGSTDGTDDNLSWNCGWEGDGRVSREVMALRRQQVKNFFCLLMLANGTPMFCAGDEFMGTQKGINNPDNQRSWCSSDERGKPFERSNEEREIARQTIRTIRRARSA
jgi:isoamylase